MVYGSVYGSAINEGQIDPRYATPDGALTAVQEALEVDQKLFDIIVEHDFAEASAMSGNVVMEAQLESLNESFFSGIWNSIVELFKKLKDKVVSIFHAAQVKVGAFFTKDGSELVRKYGAQFDKAIAAKKKWEVPGFKVYNKVCCSFAPASDFSQLSGATVEKCKDLQEGYEKELCNQIISGADTCKELREKMMDAAFQDSGEADAASIKEVVTNSSVIIAQIKTNKSEMLKGTDALKKAAEDMRNAANKDDDEEAKKLLGAQADAAKKMATTAQTVVTKFCNASIDIVKQAYKINRKAFIYIAVRGAKGVKAENESVYDDDEMLYAVMECEDYEVDSFFDQYSVED